MALYHDVGRVEEEVRDAPEQVMGVGINAVILQTASQHVQWSRMGQGRMIAV